MRVLLLTDILSNGGLERQLALLATHMPAQYELRVLALGGGPFVDYLRTRGVPVATCERRGRFDPSVLPCLWQALSSWRPDVVHSWGWVSTLSAGPMCRALGIPLIDGTIRTSTPPSEFVALKRFGMETAALVVANSRAGLESWRVPVPKGRVIHNGFDASRLAVIEKSGRVSSGFRVVMVGRMEPEKDFEVVIAAARVLSAEAHDWRFILVGNGSDKDRLQASAADLVKRGVVEFVGGGIEVLDVVAGSDVGVLMTNGRLAQEGCSNALMEYMACGLPVVCGDGGGNRELVQDGVTGFVITQGDPTALAGRLCDLRRDPDRRAAMGQAGRARVLTDFSVSRMVDEYRRVYEMVLKGRRTHRRTSLAPRADAPAVKGDGLRILMLAPYPNVRGPLPTIVPMLAAQLRAMGCMVEIDRWSRHADIEPVWTKVVGRTGDLLRVVAHLKRGQFDILFVPTAHTWAGVIRDVPLVLLSRASCPHRVLHFHGSYADRLAAPGRRVFRALSRLLVRSCDAVLVLSEDERAAWTEFEPGVRFEVVLNPFVAPPRAQRASRSENDRGATAARGAGLVVLFVGRLLAEKGIFDLLEAIKLMLRQGDSISLVIAGTGPAAEEVRGRSAAHDLRDAVNVLGHVTGDELQKAYEAADVLALPTYWAEGFPTVILEAMDAGLPIVTTPIRGAADRLVDGVNALFVPARRPDLLAAALRRLGGDEEMCARMARANRLKMAEFAPEAVAPRYLEILYDVVGERRASGGGEQGP